MDAFQYYCMTSKYQLLTSCCIFASVPTTIIFKYKLALLAIDSSYPTSLKICSENRMKKLKGTISPSPNNRPIVPICQHS